MKNLIFTLLVIAMVAINKDAVCGIESLISSNCYHMDTDQGCLTTVPYQGGKATSIKIVLDFKESDDPFLYYTNWWVNFIGSDGKRTRYEKSKFLHAGSNVFTTWHHIKLPAGATGYAFTIVFNDELSNPLDDYTLSFNICEGYYKQSNLDLPIEKNNSNESFDFSNLNLIQDNIDQFKVYPNPIEKDFSVEFQTEHKEEITFQIFDIEGRLIYSTQFVNQEAGLYSKLINDALLGKGIYICKINISNLQKTLKVTKL